MVNDLDAIVADNRRQIREVGSRFEQVDDARERFFSFGSSIVTVAVEAVYRRRTTGSQAVFGHPDESKGFGRGTFGDDKGEWVDESKGGGEFTVGGRRLVAGFMTGSGGGVAAFSYGHGDADPTTSDSTLQDLVKRVADFERSKPSANTSEISDVVDSTTFIAAPGGESSEVGAESGGGELLGRATVTTDYATTDEVRVGITFEFVGDGVGKSAITNDGEASFADAIQRVGETVDFESFAIGRASANTVDKSTSALDDEVFRVALERSVDRNRAVVEGGASGSDAPSSSLPFDAGEIGVFDANGRLVWVTKIKPTDFDSTTTINLQSLYSIL